MADQVVRQTQLGSLIRLQSRALAAVSLFVDTSVWSLALRRDAPEALPEVTALANALSAGEAVLTTGLVLQELLQGFAGPKAAAQILQRFSAVPSWFLTEMITSRPRRCETRVVEREFRLEQSMR